MLGVVGLGYVGITLSAALAAAGFHVVGVDRNAERVALVNRGTLPVDGDEPELPGLVERVVASKMLTATTEVAPLAECDVIFIAVDTPVEEDRRPRFDALLGACRDAGRVMRRGALVVVESTVSPGTTKDLVAPALEEASGKTVGADFLLGHSPERLMPGKLLLNLRTLPRIVGGSTPEATSVMAALYRTIVSAPIEETDPTTAELVKTGENTFRDVKIAFANELALICEKLGADFREVRRLIDGSGPLIGMLAAGGGVGGHCIPKDPWLLLEAMRDVQGFEPRVITAARAVNQRMPLHVAALLESALSEADVRVAGARIAVLGYAFRENSGDTRNTPSELLVSHLRGRGAEVVIHDPWAAPYRGDVYACMASAHAVVIMVAHDDYRTLDLSRVSRTLAAPVLVDARHVVETGAARRAGLVFRALGRGPSST